MTKKKCFGLVRFYKCSFVHANTPKTERKKDIRLKHLSCKLDLPTRFPKSAYFGSVRLKKFTHLSTYPETCLVVDKASVLYALHFYSWNLSECMAMSKALVGIDLFALCNAPRFHRRVPAIPNRQDPPSHSWDSESCRETDRESQDVKVNHTRNFII